MMIIRLQFRQKDNAVGPSDIKLPHISDLKAASNVLSSHTDDVMDVPNGPTGLGSGRTVDDSAYSYDTTASKV